MEHDMQLKERSDPTTMTVTYELRCRRCRWYISSRVSLGSAFFQVELMKCHIVDQLTRQWAEDVVEDCDLAKDLAVVSSVHDI